MFQGFGSARWNLETSSY